MIYFLIRRRFPISANQKRRTSAAALALAVIFLCGVLGAAITARMLFPLEYRDIVESSCEQFDVDKTLVYAIIHTESGFNPRALSDAGAMGLMQIMPETFQWLQTKLTPESRLPDEKLYDPEINIRYGVYLLSILNKQYDCEVLSIAAYHAGMGSVNRWLSEDVIPQEDCSAEDIPSKITGHYVRKVERAKLVYKSLYGEI